MRFRRPISECSEGALSRPVVPLRGIYDLESLRRRIAQIAPPLSQTELGELLAPYRTNGSHNEPYTRAYICELERGRKPFTADVKWCIEHFIREQVERATHGRVTVRVKFGRVWKIEPMTECAACDRPFVIERSTAKHCKSCAARNARGIAFLR